MKKNKILSVCISVSMLLAISAGNMVFCASSKVESKISKSCTKIDTLVEQGKLEEAEQNVKSILDKNPNDTAARTKLGDIYSAGFKLEAAYREYTKALEKDPDNSDAHNGLGTIYYRKTTSSDMQVIKNKEKYYDIALQEFRKAVKLDPENYRAYNNIGKINQEIGHIDKAEENYRKAVEIEPKYSEALKNLGTVLFEKNQIDEAIDKYNTAIKYNRKNSSACGY